MRMVSGSVALAAALPLARAAATIPQYVYDYGEHKRASSNFSTYA